MSTQVAPLAKTLPARYYTDLEVFRDELERFYCEMWVCAGRTDQIANPGDYFLRQIAGESIIISRDSDHNVRAFYNVCRRIGTDRRAHVGPPVSTGHRPGNPAASHAAVATAAKTVSPARTGARASSPSLGGSFPVASSAVITVGLTA